MNDKSSIKSEKYTERVNPSLSYPMQLTRLRN